MTEPTRFPNGINDVAANSPLAQLASLDPNRYAIFFEDFVETDFGDYPADSDGVALKYAVTLDTELDYDVSFGGATGALILTTEGGDTEGGQFRLNAAPFQLTANKKAWFDTVLSVTDGTALADTSLFVGLSDNVSGTTFIDDTGATIAVDEAWGFLSVTEEAGVDAIVRDNDVAAATATDVGTLASGTNIRLTLYYNGTDTLVFVDGVQKATLTGTHPTGDAMTVMVHFKSQSANAKVLTLDYLYVAVER